MEKITGPRRLLYNLSTAGHALFDSLLLTFYVPFLLPAKEKVEEGMIQFISDRAFWGVFTVLGVIMIFGRIVDALADPLIASLSDRSQSRLGRRRVFLLFGGLPLALSTVLIFFPPLPYTSWINALYLAGIFGCFFFFYTMYVAPYIALIPELGHDERERMGMTTVQGYFALLGGAIVMIGGPLLLGLFMQDQGTAPVAAYQKIAVLLGVVGVVLLYTAVFAVDERRFSSARPSTESLVHSFKLTIRNRPFLVFLAANMCFWFVFNMVRSSALPIGERLMRASVEFSGLNFTVLFAVAGVCFVLVFLLAKRVGKRIVMMMGLASFGVLSFLIALTGVVPVDPVIWGLVCFGLFGFPTAVLLVIPNVFISELCDYDFRRTGQRREAMYFGVHGFFLKLNLGISAAVLAFFYSVFGKDIANPLGVRLAVVAGGLVGLVGLLVVARYPEAEVKAGESES
jgi:GPH family glycoside/pentoside/hexuronide:cation symporter